MEHYITALSSHCNDGQKDRNTIHWILAVCKCGQLFTETCTSTQWREAGLNLSRKLRRHVAEENEHNDLARTQLTPRVDTR